MLFYTISNLTDDSIKCIELLYKSLKLKISDVNFKIVVDSRNSNNKIAPYILDKILFIDMSKYEYNHIFCLKFVKEIFDQPYDYFCYLDSDILYFLDNYSFSPYYNYFCYEGGQLISKFFSMYWPSDFVIDKRANIGINAGFFAINKETGFLLHDFMKNYLYTSKNTKWWIEQNMFNLFIYQQMFSGIHKHKWIDYSNKIKLFAEPHTKFIDNRMYHFCGKVGNMELKYNRMNNFLINNNII